MAVENAKTVERAVKLLFDLAANPAGFTVTELAARLDTQRPPLYRLLQTLSAYHLIRRDEFKVYTLSVGVLELARAVAEPLETLARPLLQDAANATNATAMLILAEGDALVTVQSVTPNSQDMQLTTPVGFLHPDGPTAPRVAIQAGHKPSPDDSPAVIEARARGYAITRGMTGADRTAVAVPVNLGGGHPEGCVMLLTIREADEVVFAATARQTAARVNSTFATPSTDR